MYQNKINISTKGDEMKKLLKGINYLVMAVVFILPIFLGIYLFNNGAEFFRNGQVEIFSLINYVMLIIAILLLPFGIFKFNRGIVGKVYILFGYLNMFLLWIWSALHVFGFWGWPGLIIGGIIFGVGVIIIGLGTFIYYNLWGQVWSIAYAGFMTFLFIYIGNKFLLSYEKAEKNSNKRKVKNNNISINNGELKKLERYMKKELYSDNISNVFENIFEIMKLRNNQLNNMVIDEMQVEECIEEEGDIRIPFKINDYRYNFYLKKIEIGSRKHFFARIQNAKKSLKANIIVGLDEETNLFKEIHSDFLPDNYFPYLKVIPFQFDQGQYGVIFWYSYRFDSKYNILKYEESHYKIINISDNMRNGHLIPNKIKTGKITNVEYGSWENKSVHLNSKFLSMADLSKYLRRFEVSYKWDKNKHKFDIEDWEEIYNELSIVNLFLENILNSNLYDAKNFIVSNSNLYDSLFIKNDLEINDSVSSHMSVLSPVRTYIENNDLNIDYNNDILKVGVFDSETISSKDKNTVYNLENLNKVIYFELTKEDSPRILNIYVNNKKVSSKRVKGDIEERQKITSERFLIKMEKVKNEYAKVIEDNAHLMYSDKANLPYSKRVIKNTLKILAVYACFSDQKSLFNFYKIAYDQIANFQNMSEEEKEDIKLFNDFSLIKSNNQEIMEKTYQHNHIFDSDIEELLEEKAESYTSVNQKLYNDYTRDSNTEYDINNLEFNNFINDARSYLKEENLNELYFAEFKNFYSYLEVSIPKVIKEIYLEKKDYPFY